MFLKRWPQIAFIGIVLFVGALHGKVVEYHLEVSEKEIKLLNEKTLALAVNSSIPAPVLKATVGDMFRVFVKNNMDEETSIHWHGVLVPNDMDGVPYINTPPIKPGETFLYEFPIKHSGTYWYHAHSGLQEQRGVYGGLVFYSPNEVQNYDEEYVLVLSDWSNEDPEQVQANLKKDSEYYALKKHTVQPWSELVENGWDAIALRFQNSWNQMGPMDISDVGYDGFLINGKTQSLLSAAKPGSRLKLRIINAAASTYFLLEYSGSPMTIVAADGMNVDPIQVQRMRIAMAETYDVIVDVPENKTYEFKATAEDGTGFAIVTIGEGDLVPAPIIPKPNLSLMDHSTHEGHQGGDHQMMSMPASSQDHMSHENMDHSAHKMGEENKSVISYLSDYNPLKSKHITTLPPHNPERTYHLHLTGNMERYVWTVNNEPMYDSDIIKIKKGENVKFVLTNDTMMHHPIHIHGHFFRVLNGQGDYSPLKHTVNVAPFETVEIEFEADQEKDWIFHCHNLYHMSLGMGGIISYQDPHHPNSHIDHNNHGLDHGDKWFRATNLDVYSNYFEGENNFSRNDDNFILKARHNYKYDREAEVYYKRYIPQISQYFALYGGGDFENDHGDKDNRAVLGAEYLLPFLITGNLRIDDEAHVRFKASNEHHLFERLSFQWDVDTDAEYTFQLKYTISEKLYISGNYDSREQFGVGLSLRF